MVGRLFGGVLEVFQMRFRVIRGCFVCVSGSFGSASEVFWGRFGHVLEVFGGAPGNPDNPGNPGGGGDDPRGGEAPLQKRFFNQKDVLITNIS